MYSTKMVVIYTPSDGKVDLTLLGVELTSAEVDSSMSVTNT